ncbi:MAG: 30S ribosomal protein S3 [Chloroflexi bacterium]|nr:30S ribosomal protein S3 [Chloroflexota bacterium]
MGRKVHPLGFRLGYNQDWRARWYAEGKNYRDLLAEDLRIRQLIRRQMARAGITDIEIDRSPNQITVTIHTARPGIIIGRKGQSVNELRGQLERMTGKKIRVEVLEVEQPEMESALIAESIAQQLERRISHRRAMKQAVLRATRLGVQGIKIVCAGRLGGNEMARRERIMEGRVPLATLRSNIDYAKAESYTTFGRIGVKVWVYKGEKLPQTPQLEPVEAILE